MAMADAREGALEIVRRLRSRGHRALWAGGCVRDMLLGTPPQDYDIATDAPADRVARLFPGAIEVGAHFGVALVRMGGHTFEVARFRRDGDYSNGRHPDRVVFTDEREDALRRDFTVNGMFYDPVEDRVIDYVGGREDLDRRVIRTIGDPLNRFGEDRLRMMRAIRFACRLHWGLEPRTLRAIREQSSRIREISWERVRDEFVKILTEGGAPLGIRWLIDSGLMAHTIPEVAAMEGIPQPAEYHPEGDVLTHTLIMLGVMRSPSPELAAGVLLHDVGKPGTFDVSDRIRFTNHVRVGAQIAGGICNRLRYSTDQTRHITRLVADHHRFMHVREMRPSKLKRFLRTERFDDHLELHRLDCLASHGNLANHRFCRNALEDLLPEDIRPAPLITGHDLIALGYTPGPAFKQVLSAVEDGQLEGKVTDRESALALADETLRCLLIGGGAKASGGTPVADGEDRPCGARHGRKNGSTT